MAKNILVIAAQPKLYRVTKAPAELHKSVTLDFAEPLLPGETVSSVAVTDVGGLVAGTAVSGANVEIDLTAGNNGELHLIQIDATGDQGSVRQAVLRVEVTDPGAHVAPVIVAPGAMVFRDDWDALTSYIRGNVVRHGDGTWYALRPNTGVTPEEGPDWAVLTGTATAEAARVAAQAAQAEAEAAQGVAEQKALETAADRVATGQDRTQTGLDAQATAADRIATGEDRAQTGLDAQATAADRIATGEDRVQTGLDAQATAADRIATGQDRAQTGLDAQATAADRIATGEDRVQTGLDAQATAADRIATGEDRVQTGLDAQAAEDAAENAVATTKASLVSVASDLLRTQTLFVDHIAFS